MTEYGHRRFDVAPRARCRSPLLWLPFARLLLAVALLLVDGGLPLAEGDVLSVVDGPFTAPADFEFGFGSCGEGLPAPATLVAIVHLKALVVQ